MTLNTLQFDDLNNDVIFDIFDNFNFEDLIAFAEINPKYRELIARHYALKYRIHEKLIILEPLEYDITTKHFEQRIFFHDAKLFAKFLRIFGQWVSRIDLQCGYKSLVGSAINEYCSESLAELKLVYNPEREVSWRNPLKKVSKLDLRVSSYYTGHANNINLTEIFPSLRHLRIESLFVFI